MKKPANKIIYRFRDFLSDRYPFPVRKLTLHTGLGCPHRKDGFGVGGCVYCYNLGFSDSNADLSEVNSQIIRGLESARELGYSGKFIAYFQTGTNTYSDIDRLRSWWRLIDNYPDDIVGLAIGTRPDCLSEEILSLLSDFSKKYMVWLELGLQSANDKTLTLINRGHDYQCFVDAIEAVKIYPGIFICAHIIFGLPGEAISDMKFTISELNRLGVHGVKIHHLQVVKNTLLAEWHSRGDIKVFEEEEYIALLADLLPLISSRITIHRLVGNIRRELLIAPHWTHSKARVVQLAEELMRSTGVYQGMLVDD